MQDNQHSKQQISLNVDNDMFVDITDKQETPNTLDTSIQMSSAIKSIVHESNSKRQSGVSIVGQQRSFDLNQTACIQDMIKNGHGPQIYQTPFKVNAISFPSPEILQMQLNQLKFNQSLNTEQQASPSTEYRTTIPGSTGFQSPHSLNLAFTQMLMNLQNVRNSKSNLSLSSYLPQDLQNQAVLPTQLLDPKHNLCENPSNTQSMPQFQKISNRKPHTDFANDFGNQLLNSKNVLQSLSKRDDPEKVRESEDTQAAVLLSNRNAVINDKNENQATQLLNQQIANSLLSNQAILAQDLIEPVINKLKQEQSFLSKLTSCGIGNLSAKSSIVAPNSAVQKINKISTQNPQSCALNSKPIEHSGGGLGTNGFKDLFVQWLEAKQKGIGLTQTRAFANFNALHVAPTMPQAKIGPPVIEPKSDEAKKFTDSHCLPELLGLAYSDQQADIKQSFNTAKHDLNGDQRQKSIDIEYISKIQQPIDKLGYSTGNGQAFKEPEVTANAKRGIKRALKSHESQSSIDEDYTPDDSPVGGDHSVGSPLKSQGGTKTFKGIPSEWHRTIKVRNPETQRTKLFFECKYPNCGRVFKKSCNLRDHFRKHTGQRPFKCSLCRKHFTQSGNLGRHLKNVHNTTMRIDEESPALPLSPQDQLTTLGKRVTSMTDMDQIEEAFITEQSQAGEPLAKLCPGNKRRRQSSVDIQSIHQVINQEFSDDTEQAAVAPQGNSSLVRALSVALGATEVTKNK